MSLKHTKVCVLYRAERLFFFWPALMTGLTTTIALVQLNLGRTSHMFATETHTHTHTLWLSPLSCLKNTPSNFISESHPITLQRFPNPAVIFTRLPYPPALVLMHYHVPGCGLRECRHNTTPDEETFFFTDTRKKVACGSSRTPLDHMTRSSLAASVIAGGSSWWPLTRGYYRNPGGILSRAFQSVHFQIHVKVGQSQDL